MVAFELQVSLLGAESAVWRQVRIPGDVHLPTVHHVLQMVMGWENRHVHEFVSADWKRYSGVDAVELQPDVLDESGVPLSALVSEPGERFLYLYDFGDDWAHEVVLEAVSEIEPPDEPIWCLGGLGACPPEDCGGVPGYLDLLERFDDPDAVEHGEAVGLLGEEFEAEAFDCREFNERIADIIEKYTKTQTPGVVDEQTQLIIDLQEFLISDAVADNAMSAVMLDGFFRGSGDPSGHGHAERLAGK